jgi:hypothetical protein
MLFSLASGPHVFADSPSVLPLKQSKIEPMLDDYTPPLLLDAHASPMSLSSGGTRPYSAAITYRIQDDSPLPDDTVSDNPVTTASITITNRSTGAVVGAWAIAPAVSAVEVGDAPVNQVWFDASSPSLPKGAYRAEISATDRYGNTSVAVADMVKEGIAPIVSYPKEGGTVMDTIVVQGTAMDPDWQNAYPFEKYAVYVAEGHPDLPSDLNHPGPEWKSAGVIVPAANHASGDDPNIGRRMMNENGALAYVTFAGNGGNYGVLVVTRTSKTTRDALS